MGRILVWTGLGIAALGGLLLLGQAVPGLRLGRLPGDIRIERGNASFYFPLTTMLLLSAILSLALWLFGRLRR
jgi:hypothetical protein